MQADRVLVLAPHPDDEVIGPGGALCQLMENGSEITVLYLTAGGSVAADEQLIEIRRSEAMSVGRQCELKQIFWDEEDTRLASGPQTNTRLVHLLQELRPNFVFLPHLFDNHVDHFATNQILAAVLEQVSDFEGDILGYEVWDHVWSPNYVLDVSSHFETKCELMELYKTPLAAMDFVGFLKHRASLNYMLYVNKGVQRNEIGFAEAYYRMDAATYLSTFQHYAKCLRRRSSVASATEG